MTSYTLLPTDSFVPETSHLYSTEFSPNKLKMSYEEILLALTENQETILPSSIFFRVDFSSFIDMCIKREISVNFSLSAPKEIDLFSKFIPTILENAKFQLFIIAENLARLPRESWMSSANVHIVYFANNLFESLFSGKLPLRLKNFHVVLQERSATAEHYYCKSQLIHALSLIKNRYPTIGLIQFTNKDFKETHQVSPLAESRSPIFSLIWPWLSILVDWRKGTFIGALKQMRIGVWVLFNWLYWTSFHCLSESAGFSVALFFRARTLTTEFFLLAFWPIRKLYWFCRYQFNNRIRIAR